MVSNEAVALNINNLQPEDSGEYTCTVGPATDTYELLVEGRYFSYSSNLTIVMLFSSVWSIFNIQETRNLVRMKICIIYFEYLI